MDLYEKNISIPGYEWSGKFVAEGDILLTDSAAVYDLSAVIRHRDAYQYNNIILDISLSNGKDSIMLRSKNLTLGSDAEGWEGNAMNDIIETRKSLGQLRNPKPGTYKFRIRHLMRKEPLPGVMSIGLRLEKQ